MTDTGSPDLHRWPGYTRVGTFQTRSEGWGRCKGLLQLTVVKAPVGFSPHKAPQAGWVLWALFTAVESESGRGSLSGLQREPGPWCPENAIRSRVLPPAGRVPHQPPL